MATTARLVPSAYTLSNTSYLTITNANNMYTNVDSTTMATINHTRSQTTAYYVYVKGFNFSSIPSNAVITSAIVKVKAYESGASTFTPSLYNNTTAISGTNFNGTIGTSATTRQVDITSKFDTYKGYGSKFGIRLQLNRSNKNTASKLYIYGAEITVTYDIPQEELFLKQSGTWQKVTTAYKKVNGAWVEQDIKTLFDVNTKYVKGD